MKGSNLSGELESYGKYQELLQEIEESRRKDTKRACIFFVLLLLVFVAVVGISLVFIDGKLIEELRSGNQSLTKNTDYLELTIPILLAIVAAFIAFLGMNCLKDMDAQLNQMRNGINAELDKEIRRIESLRKDLTDRIEVAVDKGAQRFSAELTKKLNGELREDMSKLNNEMQRDVERLKSEMQRDVTQLGEQMQSFNEGFGERKAEVDALYLELENKIKSFEQKYRWFASNEEQRIMHQREVACVFDVHQVVETMWNSEDKPDNIAELTKRYVEKVTAENSDLRGDNADYHNLAAECARHYFYDLSCQICQRGHQFFPRDVDLLADWIQYGTKIGNTKAVEQEPLAELLRIDKTQWNWRAFDFTVDFYLAAGRFGEAEELAGAFMKYCPYEERAYYSMAEVYQQAYAGEEGMDKAVAVLQRAMEKNINCPMCANKLADIFSDCGRLPEALAAANRAIQELAQEQASTNYGYAVYRRALIQDRMAYQLGTDNSEGQRMAGKAATDYQVAIASRRLSVITQNQAAVRYQMLKIYFQMEEEEMSEKNPNMHKED